MIMKTKIKPIVLLFITIILFTGNVFAQNFFPDKCAGSWEGMMYIFSKGKLSDSVAIVFTVAKTNTANSWTWKTEYFRGKQPMVKDYTLKLADAASQVYMTDEGDGIVLYDYVFGNKMYGSFETEGVYLTSSYELRGNELIFEVTSGKRIINEESESPVTCYSVTSLQRVVLKRMK